MPVTRCSPVINRIRLSTPYVNFNSRPSPADRDQPDLSISSSKKQISHLSDLELKDKPTTSTWACYCHGFGSRHWLHSVCGILSKRNSVTQLNMKAIGSVRPKCHMLGNSLAKTTNFYKDSTEPRSSHRWMRRGQFSAPVGLLS